MTDHPTPFDQDVRIELEGATLEGRLTVPAGAAGIVIFVHGSGSSRHSPRNQYVARTLNQGGLATLLFDLLTPQEEQVDLQTGHLRFDIDLLANRTAGATEWLAEQPQARGLPLGYFGSSTGAAAALIAAAARPDITKAVLSRGGRPDLAAQSLPSVQAPVLLLVGELDVEVIRLNQAALEMMPPDPEKRLETVPRATHLFEEPGALEQVAARARDWFQQYLGGT